MAAIGCDVMEATSGLRWQAALNFDVSPNIAQKIVQSKTGITHVACFRNLFCHQALGSFDWLIFS